MSSTVALGLPDGTRIVVPSALNQITPYVLHEQGDWFEQDIRFVRQVLQPAERAIDIGANHGVYTLSLAQAVGPAGHVWAFEPGAAVRQLLESSVALNGFNHVSVLPDALSNCQGHAWLEANGHSELGKLSNNQGATRERVSLTTLDDALVAQGWPDVDFVKIDAEGEESNILRGAARFLSQQSPLLMYEVRADRGFNVELVDQLSGEGYDSYRLVPDPGFLVPFRSGDPLDAFALNLYACKPDRAGVLAARGKLVADAPLGRQIAAQEEPTPTHWPSTLTSRPFASSLQARWEQTAGHSGTAEIREAIALFERSQETSLSTEQRWSCLQRSLALMMEAAQAQSVTVERLGTLARVAAAAGERVVALNALTAILQRWRGVDTLRLDEPFLPPLERFDWLSPGSEPSSWLLSSVLEAHECLSSHSSFYAGRASLDRLELINKLGFAGPEMQRRLRLMRMRFPGEVHA